MSSSSLSYSRFFLQIFLVFSIVVAFICCSDDEGSHRDGRQRKHKTYDMKNLARPLTDRELDREKWNLYGKELKHPDVKYAAHYDPSLALDIYGPDISDGNKKPIIIFFHSGGFVAGDKKENYLVTELSRDFTRAGYFFAAVNYGLIDFSNLEAMGILLSKNYVRKSIYNSIRNGRQALRYIKDNAAELDSEIDTDQIYIAGYSAGAILSLHLLLTDEEDLKGCTFFETARNSEGCLDCTEMDNATNVKSSVKGGIAIAGGVFSTSHISSKDNVPLLLIHGNKDHMVPYGNGKPFKKFVKDIGIDIPGLYYELGITRERDEEREEWTIGGLKVSLNIDSWWTEKLINLTTSPISGSNQLKRDVRKCRVVEIKNGNHTFMVGEDGVMNKSYDVVRTEMLNFMEAIDQPKKERKRVQEDEIKESKSEQRRNRRKNRHKNRE